MCMLQPLFKQQRLLVESSQNRETFNHCLKQQRLLVESLQGEKPQNRETAPPEKEKIVKHLP